MVAAFWQSRIRTMIKTHNQGRQDSLLARAPHAAARIAGSSAGLSRDIRTPDAATCRAKRGASPHVHAGQRRGMQQPVHLESCRLRYGYTDILTPDVATRRGTTGKPFSGACRHKARHRGLWLYNLEWLQTDVTRNSSQPEAMNRSCHVMFRSSQWRGLPKYNLHVQGGFIQGWACKS